MTTEADEAKYREAERQLWAAEGVEPTERWLDLPRTGVRVRVQVVGDGPPVLFVHGASNGGTSWAPLAARLDGFTCYLLDRPGCGLSEPLSTSFPDVEAFGPFAESLVVDVLDALDLPSADLVATSLGGYLALRALAAHPDRLRRAVLCGWSIGTPVDKVPLLMRMTAIRWAGRLIARVPVSQQMARSMLAQVGLRQALDAGRVPPEAVAWFRAMINHTDTMANELAAGPPIMHLRRGVHDDVLLTDDVLGRIRTPVQLVWGAGDLFGGEQVARAFAARIPGATLDVVPGGHAVWMDDPDGVATTVQAFLASP